ncbi:Hypothetical protein NocV09_04200010 [Nannochloropsis oceanica]
MVGTDENALSAPAFAPSRPMEDAGSQGMMTEESGGGVGDQQEQQQPQLPQLQGKDINPVNSASQDADKEKKIGKEGVVEAPEQQQQQQQQQSEHTPSSPRSSPSPSPSPEDETSVPVAKEAENDEQSPYKIMGEVKEVGKSKTQTDGDADAEAAAAPSPSPAPTPSQQQRAPAEVLDPLEIGEEVSTVWGVGVLKEVREAMNEGGKEAGKEKGVYVVEAVGWKMADGKAPVMYLQRVHIEKMTPYVLYKWPTHKKLLRAIFCKEEGNKCFKRKDLNGAEKRYLDTIGVVQLMVDQELNNKQKAQKLEVLIPTLNNLGTVRLKLQKPAEACVVARTAYHLIDELEKRGPESLVLHELLALGVTEDQLFRRFKRRAAFFAGKALVSVKEWKGAVVMLEAAREIDKQLDPEGKSVDARETAALLVKARQEKHKEGKKEKAVWSKAFELSSEEAAKDEAKARRTTPTAAAGPSAFPPSLGGGTSRPPLPPGAAAAAAAAAAAGGGAAGGGAGTKKKSRALEAGKKKGGKKGGKEGGEKEGWWNEKTEYLTLLALGSAVLGGFAYFNFRNRK